MKGVHFLLSLAVLALATSIARASDPSPLQDFCVAIDDPKKALFVNGKFCKNPELVKPEDFFFSGLNIPRPTNNALRSNVTPVNVEVIPGLNTQGISLARIDFAPNGGQNAPHFHPRASETFYVAEGTLYVGFVTSIQDNSRFFSKILNKGDVFVFPLGLIHFQVNIGHTPAVALVGFNSQYPGIIPVALTVFGANPPINPDALATAFKLDRDVVIKLQKQFLAENSRFP